MKSKNKTNGHNAKAAYAAQLRVMQEHLDALTKKWEAAYGDGKLSDKINWAHAGELQRANAMLEEIRQYVKIERIQ